MGSFTTSCSNCSSPNEVDTDVLPPGSTSISCWNCASVVVLAQQSVAEAMRAPPVRDGDAAPVAGRAGGGGQAKGKAAPARGAGIDPGILKTALIGGGVLVLLVVLIVVGINLVSGRSGGSGEAAGQFRGAYNSGGERPTGAKAWQAKVARGSRFAPARLGESLFVAAYEPRGGEAATFTPDGVPAEILGPMREYHAKMLMTGWELEKQPQTTALQFGQAERFEIRFVKGYCYQIAAFGGTKAEDVDLLLYHSDGVRLIIADALGERHASVDHCPLDTTGFEYEVRMTQGKGLVSHLVYRQVETAFQSPGKLYALNRANGRKLWEAALDAEVSTAPAASGNFVVVGARSKRRSQATRQIIEEGSLSVVSALDGSEVCEYQANGPVTSSPVVVEGIAYTGSCGMPSGRAAASHVCDPATAAPSRFYAVTVETCALLWGHDVGFPVIEPPAVDGDSVYFTAGTTVYALNRLDGTQRWTLDAHAVTSAPVATDGRVIFGAQDGSVRSIDAASGELGWVFESDSPTMAMPAIVDGVVYAGGRDGTLYAIDASTGEKQWDLNLGTSLDTPLSVSAGLVFASLADRIVAVDAREGTQQFTIPIAAGTGPTTTPVVVDGLLVFTDGAGDVLAFR